MMPEGRVVGGGDGIEMNQHRGGRIRCAFDRSSLIGCLSVCGRVVNQSVDSCRISVYCARTTPSVLHSKTPLYRRNHTETLAGTIRAWGGL